MLVIWHFGQITSRTCGFDVGQSMAGEDMAGHGLGLGHAAEPALRVPYGTLYILGRRPEGRVEGGYTKDQGPC